MRVRPARQTATQRPPLITRPVSRAFRGPFGVNVSAFRKITDYVPSSGAGERGGVPFKPSGFMRRFGQPPISVGVPTPVPASGAPEEGGPFDQGPVEEPPKKKGFPFIPAALAALFFL
jgi:hypothetical protein